MPRKLASRYRGKVQKVLGPEALTALEKQEQELLRARVEKTKAAKQRLLDAAATHGIRTTRMEEESKRLKKIAYVMVGGAKLNTLTKFFGLWTSGVVASKEEKVRVARRHNWTATCCNAPGCPGGCSAFTQLRDVVFTMPSAPRTRAGSAPAMTYGNRHCGSSAQGMRPRSRGFFGSKGDSAAVVSAEFPAPRIGTKDSTTTLPALVSHDPQGDDWLGPDVTLVSHWTTGRRCFLDKTTRRMRFADPPHRPRQEDMSDESEIEGLV